MFFILIALIPLIWLALMALVVAACQAAARADGRTNAELKRRVRIVHSSEHAPPSDRQGRDTRERLVAAGSR